MFKPGDKITNGRNTYRVYRVKQKGEGPPTFHLARLIRIKRGFSAEELEKDGFRKVDAK